MFPPFYRRFGVGIYSRGSPEIRTVRCSGLPVSALGGSVGFHGVTCKCHHSLPILLHSVDQNESGHQPPCHGWTPLNGGDPTRLPMLPSDQAHSPATGIRLASLILVLTFRPTILPCAG